MLPKIEHVTFDIFVPSLKKKVPFRPFTVREEKAILMAANDDDVETKTRMILDTIRSCCLDPELNVDELATYDIEYIFLMLRAHSINNIIEVAKIINGKEYRGKVDLKKVKVVIPKEMKSLIEVTNDIKIELKPLDLQSVMEIENEKDEAEALVKMAGKAIKTVYDGDKVLEAGEDFDEREAYEFVQSLPANVFHDIMDFFQNMPTVETDVELYSEDGKDKKVVKLRGISNFF